ncbi:MAG: hypothetical protein V1914_03980 [archaeon]
MRKLYQDLKYYELVFGKRNFYKNRIEAYTENSMLLFKKIDKQDYPQVLLRS